MYIAEKYWRILPIPLWFIFSWINSFIDQDTVAEVLNGKLWWKTHFRKRLIMWLVKTNFLTFNLLIYFTLFPWGILNFPDTWFCANNQLYWKKLVKVFLGVYETSSFLNRFFTALKYNIARNIKYKCWLFKWKGNLWSFYIVALIAFIFSLEQSFTLNFSLCLNCPFY